MAQTTPVGESNPCQEWLASSMSKSRLRKEKRLRKSSQLLSPEKSLRSLRPAEKKQLTYRYLHMPCCLSQGTGVKKDKNPNTKPRRFQGFPGLLAVIPRTADPYRPQVGVPVCDPCVSRPYSTPATTQRAPGRQSHSVLESSWRVDGIVARASPPTVGVIRVPDARQGLMARPYAG